MSKVLSNVDALGFLDRKQLLSMKTKAMRSGAWFKVLQRIDRVLFDLTIRLVDNIRSSKLTRSLFVLARKLEDALNCSFSSRMRRIGLPIAQKISLSAQNMGNKTAAVWANDSSFAFFLGVMQSNGVRICTL